MEYKNTTIGNISTHWDIKSLIEVGELVDGDWITKENYTDDGVRLLQVGDIGNGTFTDKSNRYISAERAQELNCTLINPENEILISRLPNPVGRACLAPNLGKPYIAAVDVCIFRPNTSIILKEYALYVFNSKSHLNNIKKYLAGTTRARISRKNLEKIKISIPPLQTQKKIVEVLEKAEKLKEWRAESDELADEFLKSLFSDMFGNLGANNKNWEITNFGDLISVLTDYHANGSYKILKEHVTLYNKPNYALMVRTTDLEKNNFVDGVKYIDKSAYDFLKKSKVFGGEILINKIGSAGNVYLMPELNRPVSLAMNQFMIRLNEKANNIFVYYLLTSNYGEKMIKSKVKGAVTKTITKDAVRSLKIPLPSIELQKQFAEIVKQVENLKTHQKESKQEIDNLFNALMQKAFKGELIC